MWGRRRSRAFQAEISLVQRIYCATDLACNGFLNFNFKFNFNFNFNYLFTYKNDHMTADFVTGGVLQWLFI